MVSLTTILSTEMEARTSLRMGPRQKKEEQKEGKQVGADCQENQVYLLGVSFDGLCTVTLEAFRSISFYIKKSCVKKIIRDFHFTTRNRAKIPWA